MANYQATARSNYFAVKNETAFREWAKLLELEILEPTHRDKVADGTPRYAITPSNGDDSGWPTCRYHEETDECEDIDIVHDLSAHLADGEVAVLMEVGNEKLRYVCGHAVAVNSQGKTVHLDLASIYRKALKLGPNITRAEY